MRTWAIVAFIAVCFMTSGCKGTEKEEIIPGVEKSKAPFNPNQAGSDRDAFTYDCVANKLLTLAQLKTCRDNLEESRTDRGRWGLNW